MLSEGSIIMKKLMDDIKRSEFKKIYLLFGEERFLVKLYESRLKEAIITQSTEMMNFDTFKGKDFDVRNVENAIYTLPFMSEKRLVILRDTGLLVSGRKDDTDKMVSILENTPETTVVLFCEEQVDKKNRLYKKISAKGYAVDFKTPSEKELTEWVIRSLKKYGKNISSKDASLFLRSVSHNMSAIDAEVNKLIDYSKNAIITEEDIEAVCTKSLETRIFDMVEAVGNKNSHAALNIFSNMILMKESPIMVISMLARQFRLILQAKICSEKGMNLEEIAYTLGQRSFAVKESLEQGRNFSNEVLLEAINECLNTDLNIKTGKMNDKMAVELLIIKYSGV